MKTQSAFVAIVGRPNVGKSSLLNVMLGEKIAIVSDKPQTTRTKIMGVITEGEYQFVFTDTPGIHKPKTKLSEYMVKQVNDSVADVDIAIMMTDCSKNITTAEKKLIENLKSAKMTIILVVNKIDILEKKEDMLCKIKQLTDLCEFDEVIPISALNKDGIDKVFATLKKHSEEGPHYFPDDTLTDQPERVIVGEIVREKILNNMQEEVPHGTAVMVESMKDREDKNIVDIEVTILCEKTSHKGMIIGKKGIKLRTIATESRLEIEKFLDTKVNLQCWVKVKTDWRNKENVMKHLGFK